MRDKMIADKTMNDWIQQNPSLKRIIAGDEVFWNNPRYDTFEMAQSRLSLSNIHIKDAEERLNRFASYICRVFPETQKTGGIIESPLIKIPATKKRLENEYGELSGTLLLKCDSHLAISGSIKARGGIYEVLKYAEELALRHSLLSGADDYAILSGKKFRDFFSNYSMAVGSTGNLGLSIGIMGAKLGFQVAVHMSSDAKQWKKDMLRQKGVTVIECQSDYSQAVKEGRKQSDLDPNMHFVDDENSKDLFLGYAVAASRLNKQLQELNIIVDKEHPLFVYLPCGVGGSPGGIAFGLKQLFKDHVHCFFAEPTSSPCMLLGLMTGLHDQISVRDFGLNNKTDADGLAVGSPSGFVGKTLEQMISGLYTVQDTTLYKMLGLTSELEGISLEPSAAAGMPGAYKLFQSEDGQRYLEKHSLHQYMPAATHIVWATGGSMVPPHEMEKYYRKGKNVKSNSQS
jgi:D-serine dehydratase